MSATWGAFNLGGGGLGRCPLLGLFHWDLKCKFLRWRWAESRVPDLLGSLGLVERARPGVTAHLLMAGIWGVIERGGEPGARMGLHEQLNVIRLRPSGSSWVIDNPAAFLPSSRLQTGGWLRERREGPRARTLSFCPELCPLPAPWSVRG